MDNKAIIGIVIALIVIVLACFAYVTFNGNAPISLNVTENITNNTDTSVDTTDNATLVSQNPANDSEVKDVAQNVSESVSQQNKAVADSGDTLHKQTFTVSENETGQNEGMEPGTYVMYYTENDGPIKVQKID